MAHYGSSVLVVTVFDDKSRGVDAALMLDGRKDREFKGLRSLSAAKAWGLSKTGVVKWVREDSLTNVMGRVFFYRGLIEL